MNEIFSRYGGSAIVVAHSYAGAPVSEGLAGIHAVRHIVYLAAFQLDVGESALGAAGGSPAPWCHFDDGDVARVADPHDVFFSDVPPRDAEWAVEEIAADESRGVSRVSYCRCVAHGAQHIRGL